ncbi:MAG: hypothetical protein CL947_03960 [Epsilonproteobacteria bacterium]|nr:hypothetical protein [Campylobacterota bacterium]|tara:strand:+ start:2907 stop:3152 length:246 start_codon:yes stop_codon:yes gene_type:complete
MHAENRSLIEQKIVQELDKLEPYIHSHGGRIEFVKFEQSIVYLRLHGTCVDCPLSFYTLTYGIERQLQLKVLKNIRVETIE